MISPLLTGLTGVLVFLLSVEYFGKFCASKPKNPLYLGKAIVRLYLSFVYFIIQSTFLAIELRHLLVAYGWFLILLIDVVYLGIDHFNQWKGSERRDDWLRLCSRRKV